MPRTIKNFDDRYAEFLTVSQQLFFTKGYDQTSVQNIIDAMGVAKGTQIHNLLDPVTPDHLYPLLAQMGRQLEANGYLDAYRSVGSGWMSAIGNYVNILFPEKPFSNTCELWCCTYPFRTGVI